MTDADLLIVSLAGLLIGVALLITARIAARNRAKYLASRQNHPAE
jgi:hypothetical protein